MAVSTATAPRPGTLLARFRGSVDVVYRELVKFGAVGALAFVVDIGVFNLLRVGGHGGLAIALACLGFSHYVLQLTSALADNIAGNVIGLGLGTLFRFWAYRKLVFTEELSDLMEDPRPEPLKDRPAQSNPAQDAPATGQVDVSDGPVRAQPSARR